MKKKVTFNIYHACLISSADNYIYSILPSFLPSFLPFFFLFFMNQVLLMECPCEFERWDVLLEAIEYSLLKRRELRVHVVRCIVYALMLRIAFLDGKVAKIATSMAHNILIRYPNIRVGLSFMTNSNAAEEDTAANRDYAMQGK